jgi:hypothetical protein
VVRQLRFRDGSAGTKVTSEEKEAWQTTIMRFFADKSDAKTETKKNEAKATRIPRMAALDICRCLQNALEAGMSKGLQDFAEDKWSAAVTAKRVPPVLTVCMDQWQVQWSSYYFLTNGPPALCMVGVMDFNHRRSNDIWASIRAVGRTSDIISSMLCQNILSGPWQSGRWMTELTDAAYEVSSTMGVDDPLLLKLWPAIRKELGIEEAIDGVDARRAYLASLPGMDVFNCKGRLWQLYVMSPTRPLGLAPLGFFCSQGFHMRGYSWRHQLSAGGVDGERHLENTVGCSLGRLYMGRPLAYAHNSCRSASAPKHGTPCCPDPFNPKVFATS